MATETISISSLAWSAFDEPNVKKDTNMTNTANSTDNKKASLKISRMPPKSDHQNQNHQNQQNNQKNKKKTDQFLELNNNSNNCTKSTNSTFQKSDDGDQDPKLPLRFQQKPLEEEPIPFQQFLISGVTIFFLTLLGIINDVLKIRVKKETNRKDYVPLYTSWQCFYVSHFVRRVWNAMNTVIVSSPGAKLTILQRESRDQGWTIKLTNKTKECINLGSYNYLNLSDTDSPIIQAPSQGIAKFGVGNCSVRKEFGTTKVHKDLDQVLSKFLGCEKAFTFGMGFSTNALNLPSILDKDCLVLSDKFNHASIIIGIRYSGAKICVFKHNDMKDLEKKIRREIISSMNAGKPWKKIFIVIEGIYSMHGTIVNLPEVLKIKKKYGAYVYLDEAHCMGGLGEGGRGVTEYFNVNPREIDIMMGTFAKSFGAMGGYIGGSKELISQLTHKSIAHLYGTSMPVPIASFIAAGIRFLSNGTEGRDRLKNLARNSRYFRLNMRQRGFVVLGEEESPVVPIIVPLGSLYPITTFMRRKGLATVIVSYPATKVTEARIRFCMNAMHTKDMIDYTIEAFNEVGDMYNLKMSKIKRSQDHIEY